MTAALWLWGVYLGLALAVFLAIEARALLMGTPTLSRTVWALTRRWPMLPFGIGLGVGMLAVHFFGRGWCPP